MFADLLDKYMELSPLTVYISDFAVCLCLSLSVHACLSPPPRCICTCLSVRVSWCICPCLSQCICPWLSVCLSQCTSPCLSVFSSLFSCPCLSVRFFWCISVRPSVSVHLTISARLSRCFCPCLTRCICPCLSRYICPCLSVSLSLSFRRTCLSVVWPSGICPCFFRCICSCLSVPLGTSVPVSFGASLPVCPSLSVICSCLSHSVCLSLSVCIGVSVPVAPLPCLNMTITVSYTHLHIILTSSVDLIIQLEPMELNRCCELLSVLHEVIAVQAGRVIVGVPYRLNVCSVTARVRAVAVWNIKRTLLRSANASSLLLNRQQLQCAGLF